MRRKIKTGPHTHTYVESDSDWKARLARPCAHRGGPTGETRPCKECTRTVDVPLLSCALYDHCTEAKLVPGVECCRICTDRLVRQAEPSRVNEIDVGEDRAFNPSILDWQGKTLLAYRTGWVGSRLWLAEMDGTRPTRTVPMTLSHPMCAGGREDPRLFVHNDRLHLAFIGVRQDGSGTVAQQLFARLRDDYSVEHVWHPEYPRQQKWEKNWQPFSHEGEMYAVYHMRPWTVVHFHDEKAYPFSSSETVLPWVYGEPRGGAPPVRVGNEYWCWFHGTEKRHQKPTRYAMGVCAFEARPPFRPTRITPLPVLEPDDTDLPDRPGEPGVPWYASVVFPCGAVRRGDRWLVSFGYHDHWCRIAEYDHATVEGALCRV